MSFPAQIVGVAENQFQEIIVDWKQLANSQT